MKVQHGDRTFILTGTDVRAGRAVRRIVADRQRAVAAGSKPPTLFASRAEFRHIASARRISGLIECLKQGDPELVRLTIWLMGRTRAASATWAIAPFFRESASDRMRYEVARALRRLGAWAELRTMARGEPHPRVRRLAAAPAPKSFDRRFERFACRVRSVATGIMDRQPMPLVVRRPFGPGRRPKAPEFIRAILERIQRLVRGC